LGKLLLGGKNMLMAVYGTLRKGNGNYRHFLKDKKCLGTTKLKGFKMYSLGFYPCIVPTKNEKDNIIVEVFELDDEKDKSLIAGINSMERGAGYSIGEVETIFGKALYYYFNYHPDTTHIKHGDWNKHMRID